MSIQAPPLLSETDYDAIQAAVMETTRGRWFLAEYARRNRQSDTTMLLGALERLENVIRGEQAILTADRIKFDLIDMSQAIAQTKAEIAAIRPDARHDQIEEASEELDSVVAATETATSDILAATEQVQEIAWTLREQGLAPEACEALDARSIEIYTACSFQDITGQRTRKVIQVLRYLEARINSMIGIWGLEPGSVTSAPEPRKSEAKLLNGPARPGQGLDQSDVDMVMGAAVVSRPAHLSIHQPPVAAASFAQAPAIAAPPLQPAGPQGDMALLAEPGGDDLLAPLNAMSYEEKIALFS
jgi:chemotaxis regulatin CheY-phosphate phosphatase CheZ